MEPFAETREVESLQQDLELSGIHEDCAGEQVYLAAEKDPDWTQRRPPGTGLTPWSVVLCSCTGLTTQSHHPEACHSWG